jgi:LytS/YehU family sensor histidine kinase
MSAFLLKQAVEEVVEQVKTIDSKLILLSKLNLPREIYLSGEVANFQYILQQILLKAGCSYCNNCVNKIVLLSSKFESDNEISLSVTDGGQASKETILRERGSKNQLSNLALNLKNQFAGKLEIFNQCKLGKTVKCRLPLSQ